MEQSALESINNMLEHESEIREVRGPEKKLPCVKKPISLIHAKLENQGTGYDTGQISSNSD